ncbi:hypothetical protein RRG08_019275 [Elysia crispata]|uniref:Uncharacterized protein n=1 Tax=Elysia crispata TaxID=231223 RepID=A0AAE1CIX8_9GAST|nr:hypothetical protein RRG08_019275 [Elysia crispata]
MAKGIIKIFVAALCLYGFTNAQGELGSKLDDFSSSRTTQRNAEAAAGSTNFKLYCTYSSLSAFTLTGPAWEVTEMRGTAFFGGETCPEKGRGNGDWPDGKDSCSQSQLTYCDD